MKFHDYTDFYKWENRDGGLAERGVRDLAHFCELMHKRLFKMNKPMPPDEHETLRTKLLVGSFEQMWAEMKRPYYDIYPSIIPTLEKLNMDFPLTDVCLPMNMPCLLLRFPADYDIATVFLGYNQDEPEDGDISRIVINAFMSDELNTMHDHMTITICWAPGRTGTELFAELRNENTFATSQAGEEFELDVLERIFRIAIGICMIGNDPSLLEPQILNKDLAKLNEENADRLFEKAKKRGKFGYSLGKSLEKIPHIRRPHLCWVAHGPGRKLRKLIMRKGSIIHREVIEKMPTGELDG